MKTSLIAGLIALAFAVPAHAITATNSSSALDLANAIVGSGVTISNAVLTQASSTATGSFSGGLNSVGFDSGIVLTTGTTGCVAGPNSSTSCTGDGTLSSLKFDFTSSTGKLFFNYVFASEEYNEFVNQGFNDSFKLLLNGVNIALLPGAGGAVTIDNVNCGSNSAYFRNNSSTDGSANCVNQNLDIQYDGLTTILTAGASLLAGTNTFEFQITDNGDADYDSGVFIKAGSFSGTNPNDVPEPGSLALAGLAFAGLAASRRRKTA